MTDVALVVPASLDGVRVDKAVALVADLSRSAVDRLIGQGGVVIDGTPATSRRTVLRAGQLLRVEAGPPEPSRPGPDPSVPFGVVHEDADLVVVDKPAGLVVHPGAGHVTGTLVNGLLARYPELAGDPEPVGDDPVRPGIVHRLDRGTSGLMVVARRPSSYRTLVAQLADRRVSRRYRTLVEGVVADDVGAVDAPIGRSTTSPTRMAVSRRGREARTHYRVVQRFIGGGGATLLEVVLDTGRTHQIRVHLAAIGHPVAGDPVYGRSARPGRPARPARPFLHAEWLAFEHPATRQEMEFSSPLPEDLALVLAELER